MNVGGGSAVAPNQDLQQALMTLICHGTAQDASKAQSIQKSHNHTSAEDSGFHIEAFEKEKHLNPREMCQWRRTLFSVYVGHLPGDVTMRELVQIFTSAGEIKDLHVQPADNMKNYTYGFIRYKTIEEARRAVSTMNGRVLGNKHIVVELASETRMALSPQQKDKEEIFCERDRLMRRDYPTVVRRRSCEENDEDTVQRKVTASLAKLQSIDMNQNFLEKIEEILKRVAEVPGETTSYATVDEGPACPLKGLPQITPITGTLSPRQSNADQVTGYTPPPASPTLLTFPKEFGRGRTNCNFTSNPIPFPLGLGRGGLGRGRGIASDSVTTSKIANNTLQGPYGASKELPCQDVRFSPTKQDQSTPSSNSTEKGMEFEASLLAQLTKTQNVNKSTSENAMNNGDAKSTYKWSANELDHNEYKQSLIDSQGSCVNQPGSPTDNHAITSKIPALPLYQPGSPTDYHTSTVPALPLNQPGSPTDYHAITSKIPAFPLNQPGSRTDNHANTVPAFSLNQPGSRTDNHAITSKKAAFPLYQPGSPTDNHANTVPAFSLNQPGSRTDNHAITSKIPALPLNQPGSRTDNHANTVPTLPLKTPQSPQGQESSDTPLHTEQFDINVLTVHKPLTGTGSDPLVTNPYCEKDESNTYHSTKTSGSCNDLSPAKVQNDEQFLNNNTREKKNDSHKTLTQLTKELLLSPVGNEPVECVEDPFKLNGEMQSLSYENISTGYIDYKAVSPTACTVYPMAITAKPPSTGDTYTPTSIGDTSSPTHTGVTSTLICNGETSSPTCIVDTSRPTNTGDTSQPTNTGDISPHTHTGDISSSRHTGDTSPPKNTGDASPTYSETVLTSSSSKELSCLDTKAHLNQENIQSTEQMNGNETNEESVSLSSKTVKQSGNDQFSKPFNGMNCITYEMKKNFPDNVASIREHPSPKSEEVQSSVDDTTLIDNGDVKSQELQNLELEFHNILKENNLLQKITTKQNKKISELYHDHDRMKLEEEIHYKEVEHQRVKEMMASRNAEQELLYEREKLAAGFDSDLQKELDLELHIEVIKSDIKLAKMNNELLSLYRRLYEM